MTNVSATALIERLGLPAAAESERMILGALLTDGRERMDQIRYSLDETCFSLEAHRVIWRAMAEIYDAGDSVDRIGLAQALHTRGKLESIGGISELAALDNDMPAGLQLDSHIRILHEKATLRKAIVAVNDITLRLLDEDPSADVMAYAQATLDRIATESPGKSNFSSVEEIIEAAGMDFMEPRHNQGGVPMPAEWPQLRLLLPALRPGHLIVLAARTSAGKSAFALHLALAVANAGNPVAILTLEMPKLEWAERAACHLALVNSYRHQNHTMDTEERARFVTATQKLRELPLRFDDRSGVTVASIHVAIQKMRPRPRLVIVDYLQLLSASGRHNTRAAEVSEISRGLKRMATHLGIPVIALSQFSRESAKQGGREPELHDLKESGDIENDANVAIFIHPEPPVDRAYQPVRVLVKKNRGGALGRVNMSFKKPYYQFVEDRDSE